MDSRRDLSMVIENIYCYIFGLCRALPSQKAKTLKRISSTRRKKKKNEKRKKKLGDAFLPKPSSSERESIVDCTFTEERIGFVAWRELLVMVKSTGSELSTEFRLVGSLPLPPYGAITLFVIEFSSGRARRLLIRRAYEGVSVQSHTNAGERSLRVSFSLEWL